MTRQWPCVEAKLQEGERRFQSYFLIEEQSIFEFKAHQNSAISPIKDNLTYHSQLLHSAPHSCGA